MGLEFEQFEVGGLERLLGKMPALVAVLDAEGRFASVNSAWNSLLGWQAKDLIGSRFDKVTHPEDVDFLPIELGSLPDTQSQVFRVRHKDESYRYFSWTTGDAPPNRMAIGINVTPERSKQARAEAAKARLESFLRTIPGYVVVVDRELRIEYVNRAEPGASPDHALGTHLLSRIDSENHKAISDAIAIVFAGGQASDIIAAVGGANGVVHWYRTAICPLEHDGQIISVILFGDDITQHVQDERARAQASRFEAVGRVSAAIVHDLNNIFMAIGAASELLSLRDSNPDNREDIDLLLSVVEQGRDLTSHLMVPFRKNAPVETVTNLVATVCELEPLLLRTGKGLLAIDIADPGREILVELPPHEVSQLLLNLVVNAAEAMPSGGCVNIGFDVGDSAELGDDDLVAGRYVTLVVQDNGPGVPYEVREKVFDPFFTTKKSGSGFGLATCYAIAKRYRGQITLTCPSSGGSRLEIRLPIIEDSKVQAREKATVVGAVTVQVPHSAVARAPVVLLAEDSATARVALVRYLNRQGYEVLESGNGDEALRVAEAYGKPIDILITDIIMPQRDGTSLIREILRRQPGLPVLAMSGYALPEQHEELKSMGVRLLAKPILPSELLMHLQRLLNGDEQPALD